MADNILPKFYSVIDRGDARTAAVILDRIDAIAETQESDRILGIIEYIVSDIELKYDVAKYVVAKSSTPVLYTPDFTTQFG